jgi:hypothetical protein
MYFAGEGMPLTENFMLKSCEQNSQFLLSILKNEMSCGGHEIVLFFHL